MLPIQVKEIRKYLYYRTAYKDNAVFLHFFKLFSSVILHAVLFLFYSILHNTAQLIIILFYAMLVSRMIFYDVI